MTHIRASALLVLALPLVACQNENRYELSKDSAGHTIRLDKRTGEIAVVEGDQISTLKDAAQVEAKRASKSAELGKLRTWTPNDFANFGGRAFLATSWRDGKLLYNLRIVSLSELKAFETWHSKAPLPDTTAKKREDMAKIMPHAYTIELSDSDGFHIQEILARPMTEIVDNDGHPDHLEHKDSIPMTAEDYQRIARWELSWR